MSEDGTREKHRLYYVQRQLRLAQWGLFSEETAFWRLPEARLYWA